MREEREYMERLQMNGGDNEARQDPFYKIEMVIQVRQIKPKLPQTIYEIKFPLETTILEKIYKYIYLYL